MAKWTLGGEAVRFFDNTGGGGISYGGSSPGTPLFSNGQGGGSNGQGGGKASGGSKQGGSNPDTKLPYKPGDYKYHEYYPPQEVHYNGKYYDDQGAHRCDGWVTDRDDGWSEPLPACPKPPLVSWKAQYISDWHL